MTTEKEYLHLEITDNIIKCFYDVYNILGFGFLEKIYEKSLKLELGSSGLKVAAQHPVKVYYNTNLVGEYFADLIVENRIIIELKAIETLLNEHELQLINYLKATDFEIGLLLNFGKRPEVRRKIYTNKF